MQSEEIEKTAKQFKGMLKDVRKVGCEIHATELDIYILLNILYLKAVNPAVMYDTSKWRPLKKAYLYDVYSTKNPGTIHFSLEGTPPKIHLLLGPSSRGMCSAVILDHSFRKSYVTFNAKISIKDIHFKWVDAEKTKTINIEY